MKAIVYKEFGSPDVLHLDEIEKPSPKINEVLVRIHASPVNYGDLMARNFKNISMSDFHMPLPLLLPTRLYFGWSKPKVNVLGNEFSGEVEAVGESVTRFKAGDQVMGYSGQKMGAYAEYICMPENGTLSLKPANMNFAEASAIPYGTIMATSLLKKANIQPGSKVLINGASGGIGSTAVQLARHFGAEVTGVCATPRVQYVKSLGADRVIDYTKDDFTRNGETYDLIFDILGKSTYSRCKNSLKPNGVYLLASFKMKALLQMLWTRLTGSKKKVICAFASEKSDDLAFVKELIEAGKVKVVVDKSFPMELAADAHRYAESGQKQGSIIISMGNSGS
jgi:NADPH:quinone reductase-like Zn-dependent oxidoreductase